MVRVIYRWQVDSENLEEFQNIWRETTNRIHHTVEGALGSFMLKSVDDETEVLTVAKWESVEAWKSFWGKANPKEMIAMKKLGARVSAEAFLEIEDHTR